MRTQRTLRSQIAPEVLEAIANGTASAEMREAYRLQLAAAQKEPLLAAGIMNQTDWIDTKPMTIHNGQTMMF